MINRKASSKRKLVIGIVIACIILFTPFRIERYKDGGTKTFSSMTYIIISWNQLDDSPDGYRTGIEIHYFPNNFHNLSYYD